MRRILLLLVVTVVATSITCSAQNKRKNDALCYRISDLVYDGRVEEAEVIVDSMLNIYPLHADMLYFKACHLYGRGDIDAALDLYARALDNLGRKNCMSKSLMLYYRSCLYMDNGDYSLAIKDCTDAIASLKRNDKDLLADILMLRAECYYYDQRYEMAESDLLQVIYMADGNSRVDYALSCICSVYREMGEYDNLFDYAQLSLSRSDRFAASVYKTMIFSCMDMGDTHRAIDYAIDMVLNANVEIEDEFIRGIFFEDIEYARSAIYKRISADAEGEYMLEYINLCDCSMEFGLSYELLKCIAEDLDEEESLYWLAHYSNMAGKYQCAVEHLDNMLEICSDENRGYCTIMLADNYYSMGDYEMAIAESKKFILLKPDDGYGYCFIGCCYEFSGDDANAMECYNKAIELDQTDPYPYLMRGEQYLKVGDMERARADFEHILEIDSGVGDDSVRHYALYFLGDEDGAKQLMQNIVDRCPYDNGVMYTAACFYAIIGDLNQSLDYLRLALCYGFRSKAHIENDDDLDPIRNMDAFEVLMNEYFNL